MPAVEAHRVHDAALGPPAQVLRAVLGDRRRRGRGSRCSRRPRTSRARACARPPRAAAGSSCATSAPSAHSPTSRAPSARRPPRQHLLEQRDVPVPAVDRRRELAEEVAAARLHRAAVKEVPRQAPRIARAYICHACRATSSPAASSPPADLDAILDRAAALKAAPLSSRALEGRSVALLFQAPSTRTRLSFEAGVFELGGHPARAARDEMQLSRGESLVDTARVLSRHVAAFGVRTTSHAPIEELAAGTPTSPSSTCSPSCTTRARRSPTCSRCARRSAALAGHKLAYVGDGNNVARSLAVLGALAGVEVAVASPAGYALAEGDVEARSSPTTRAPRSPARTPSTPTSGCRWATTRRGRRAPRGARALPARRRAARRAPRPGAIALHCLPAHPGEEITAEVLYGDAPAHLGPGREPPPRPEGAAEWLLVASEP